MGIGNPICAARLKKYILFVSLPLMGIGNKSGLVPLEEDPDLITPHGDRKRTVPGRQGDSHRDLITPHGDRKLGTHLAADVTFSYSLPLMGIGNGDERRAGARHDPTHYPSWGSETKEMVFPLWVASTNSLPLMGIGNADWLPDGWLADYLITPHGDRKPLLLSRSGLMGSWAHYPSWGSETRVKPQLPCGNSSNLITPHGDRKPDSG